jgi:hypothetical protein
MAKSGNGGNDTTTQSEMRSRETEPEMTAYLQARPAAEASPVLADDAGAADTQTYEPPEEREMPQRAMDQ